MVTRLQIRKALVEYGLQHKTNAEIDAALAQVDQEVIVAAERAKLSVVVWDKQSPINGVAPDDVCRAHNISESCTAYMIMENGQIVYFQPICLKGNPVTPDNAQAVGEAHADELAKARAIPAIIEAVIEQLDA